MPNYGTVSYAYPLSWAAVERGPGENGSPPHAQAMRSRWRYGMLIDDGRPESKRRAHEPEVPAAFFGICI